MVNEQSIRDWFKVELRERMEENGLRSYHMAYLCRVKPGNISNYLQGSSLPSLWCLILMCENLGCSVNDLLGYEEPECLDFFEKYRATELFDNERQYASCLSERIRRYMSERDTTIAELSERSGFNSRTLSRWLTDRPQLPRTSDFLQICDALDCTPSELLGY